MHNQHAQLRWFNRARFTAPTATLLGERLEIGEGTWIGYNVVIDAQVSPVVIGKNCDISSGVLIHSHSTHLRCVRLDEKRSGSVILGDHVYVGPNVVVEPGTRVGSYSIIGALSRVRGVFPPRSFIVGNPAKVKSRVESVRRNYPKTGSWR